METTVRTIYGSALQTAQMLGLPYVIPANTTLNERFAIQTDAVITPGTYPRVGYFCIGNGGHQSVMGADNIPLAKEVQHEATDASLYKPLPFVLRAVNNDLTALQRANYGLRRLETYGGVNYYAYYLKRIDLTTTTVQQQLQTVDPTTQNITSVSFVATNANLVPTPPVLSNTGVNTLSGSYVTCSAVLTISLSEAECTEILNACTIIRGDDAYAIISEIGICSGTDKVILLSDSTNYNEAVGVQVAAFVNTMHLVKYTATGITGLFNFGTNDNLYTIG